MRLNRFSRSSGESVPGEKNNSRRRRVGLAAGVLLLAGGLGGYAGAKYGDSTAREDCGSSFGPDAMHDMGQAHPLTAQDIAAMKELAKGDTKPVSFHTSEADLKDIGLGPILQDLPNGEIISVMIPKGIVDSDAAQTATNNALSVQNILRSWSQDPDSMVRLQPEGTSQQVDPSTELLVQIKDFTC